MDFRLKLKNLVKSPSEHLSPSHHSSSQRHALHLNSISGRILSDSTPTKSEADPTTERLVRVLRVYQKQKEARQLNQNPDDTDPLLQAELEQSIDRSFLNEPACFSSVHTSTVSQEHDTTPTERQTCFDGGSYVLQRLPLNLDSGFLMHEKQRYERQLRVVSRKVCDLATKRKDQLETQLSKVIELQRKVAQADHVCSEGRAHLKQCKSKLSDPGLLVLAKKQKRDRVQRLLEQLLVIRRLRETERVLANLLRSDDKLPQAVRISINCEREARALESFQCVSLIPDRLHRITQLLEQQAADALGRQCLHFCPNSYARILRALELLNRSQTILDLILLHSTDALHDRACSVLIGYVQLMNLPQQSESGSLEPLRKKPFDQLCHLLPIDVLLPCLADLGRTCYELLLNYRRIAAWHQQQLRLLEKEPSNETADDEDVVTKIVNIDDLLIDADHDYNKNNDYEHANNCMDSNWICRLDRTLVDQKLTHAARRLWHETQRKWITLLTGHDLSSLSFDQLLIILRLMRKAQQLGAEFCGSESSELEEAISRLASNYLLSFHRSKMDELRLYLDMEEWVRFPVRNSFSIDQLHEFKSLHEKRRSAAQFHSSIASSRDCDQYFTVEIIESNDSKFENPFELSSDDSPDTSFLITDECSSPGSASELSDDENHELAVPTVDATTDSSTESRRHSPIVSNSTLGLSRLLGKYLQAMCMLEPLAFDVLLCAFQLLDMYIFGVYSFFASTSSSMLNTSSTVTLADTNSLDVLIPGQLKNVIDRIEKSLLFPDQDGKTVTNDSPKKIRYCRPKLNPAVILSEPTNLFGLPQRIVAVESLMFLADELNKRQDTFKSLLCESKHHWLNQYFESTLSVLHLMRNSLYGPVAANVIDWDQLKATIERVNWDIRELPSQPNAYVIDLLTQLKLFGEQQNELIRRQLNCKVPKVADRQLWTDLSRFTFRTLIDGFAGAKKCSYGGRAAMRLDLQHLATGMYLLARQRPLPDQDLAEQFITAFFYNETQLEEMVRVRNRYSVRQVRAVIQCALADNRRARSRLLSMLEQQTQTSDHSPS